MASTIIKPPSPAPEGPKPGGMARAAGAVMAATLLSRVLGQIRDIVIAHQIGAGVIADSYTAAFKVPDLFMYLLAGGALASTFIPVFKEHLQLGKSKTAWQIFSVVATVTALVAVVFVAIAEIWTPEFVRLLNPGYSAAAVALTVPLTRIVLPAQIFFMLGGLLMGTLNAREQFLLPALAPSIYNLGIIFGAAVLYPLGFGPEGLMWGALGGAFVGNFALQVVLVARTGGRYRPSLAVLHPGAVRVWKMMLPILLGVSLPNVDQIINSYFASELAAGSQAALQYAVRLMLIPIGIFAQAMGIAILPAMSGLAAEGKTREFRATVSQALRTILFLTIPASALLCLLAVPTITLLLQSGQFTAHDTATTATALRFLLGRNLCLVGAGHSDARLLRPARHAHPGLVGNGHDRCVYRPKLDRRSWDDVGRRRAGAGDKRGSDPAHGSHVCLSASPPARDSGRTAACERRQNAGCDRRPVRRGVGGAGGGADVSAAGRAGQSGGADRSAPGRRRGPAAVWAGGASS